MRNNRLHLQLQDCGQFGSANENQLGQRAGTERYVQSNSSRALDLRLGIRGSWVGAAQPPALRIDVQIATLGLLCAVSADVMLTNFSCFISNDILNARHVAAK